MGNNKYYTPEIEEFHVGFEYEAQDLGDDMKNWVWRKQVFEGEETRTYFIEELDKGEMRVKFIDRDDIESLKWSSVGSKPYHFEIKSSVFTFGLAFSEKDNRVIIYETVQGSTSVIFNGFIKNKSELKKLMKQLRIE